MAFARWTLLGLGVVSGLLNCWFIGAVWSLRPAPEASVSPPVVRRLDDRVRKRRAARGAALSAAAINQKGIVSELRTAGYPSAVILPAVRGYRWSLLEEKIAGYLGTDLYRRYQVEGFPPLPAIQAKEVDRLSGEAMREMQDELTTVPLDGRSPSEQLAWERYYGAQISREKLQQVAQIRRDYGESETALLADGLTPADRMALRAAVDHEARIELARILTPEEFFALELRDSAASAQLRRELQAQGRLKDLSEAEFSELFRQRFVAPTDRAP